MTKRVVITGIGWVTPLGWDIESVWKRLLAGEAAMREIPHFDASTYPTRFCAAVGNEYDYNQYVTDHEVHAGVSLNTQFALGASQQAWTMAGLNGFDALDRDRVGIYLGSGEGSLDFANSVTSNLAAWQSETSVVDTKVWVRHASKLMSAMKEMEQEPNMPLTHIAMEFDLRGPAYNCLTACAASTQAIGEATASIRRGETDVMVTGGAHTMIHPLGVMGFNRLTALSTRNDTCLTASRPFSRDRDGFVLGEGAGMLVIESLDHARQRGAKPLAEIVGFGSSADAYRITDIQPEGKGAIASMTQALEEANRIAGVTRDDVQFIAAHGTGTKENDSIETKAVKTVFGDRAKSIPMNSIKSMIGHLIAAAGAVQLIATILAMRDSRIPPTINLHNPDPECDMDYVPNVAREQVVNVAVSNSFGFGGQNDTLVVKKFE